MLFPHDLIGLLISAGLGGKYSEARANVLMYVQDEQRCTSKGCPVPIAIQRMVTTILTGRLIQPKKIVYFLDDKFTKDHVKVALPDSLNCIQTHNDIVLE